MKKTYQLKTNAIKGEQQVIDIAPGTGKAPVVVPAASAARYELIDTATRSAPDTIRVMRKGKNLQIFFDGEKEPGAVIENYYEAHTDGSPTLVGSTEQGALYEYIPESASPQAIASELADSGKAYGMALGGQELPASGAAVGLLAPVVGAISPWLLGAGAVGAAAVVGGGKGGGDTGGGVIVYEANTGKKTAMTLNPVTVDNIITTGENTGNIALKGQVSGNFAAGDLVTIYANGKTYTGTAASDGSFSIDVPASELATDKDTRIEAKVTGTGGDTANAAQDYAVETSANAGKTTALSIDPIAVDNFINATEATGSIHVTGKATGAFSTSDTVTLTINGKTYSGTPQADGTFSIPVPAAELIADQDTTVDATIGTSASALQNYGVDTDLPTNADVGLTIAITTDADNSGVVNASELGNVPKLTSHISVNSKAVVGDKVVITATNNGGTPTTTTIEHVLAASDIKNGFDVTFDKPVDGTTQVVSAYYKDAAGNEANDKATDSALLDATVPTASVTAIIDDTAPSVLPDSQTTYKGPIANGGVTNDISLKITGSLSAAMGTGDTVHVYDGNNHLGIATVNGLDWSFDDRRTLVNGQQVSYTAQVFDAAGNSSDSGTPYTAILDTHAMSFGDTSREESGKAPATLGKVTFTFMNATGGALETGTYKLHLGTGVSTVLPSKSDGHLDYTTTSEVSSVSAKDVYLEFWDQAGNYSTAYLTNNADTATYKIPTNVHFVV